ncbi:class I SAM-dependent methyltransferase [Shimia sagamensis]|uniref:Methyltransferase domain-containing protein n=1 Tax=Shimia sagamensis TaxID=1566352 RepID=A0ABY1P3N7_9RHOB|nr:class I SAM-dependent methyltransferase [Shimia sagamensis]SMP25761.1 Methyltransferase domain-containing protein [Shimia sagamensis]
MSSTPDFATIKAGMADVYERQAEAWDIGRDTTLRERDWLSRWLEGLPTPSALLDLGCGSGRPLAAYLTNLGHGLTGVDASAAMIDRAQSNVPRGAFQVADMRQFDLGHTFDAILSWDAFFHLSPGEQRAALPVILNHLKPGGHLLLTVGDDEGEVTGIVAGEPVYHGSLSPAEYLNILQAEGFADITYTPNDPSVLGRYVLLARGKGTA